MNEDKLGLKLLQEIARIANSTLDLDETLEHIIVVIKNQMHMDACSIYLTDEKEPILHLKGVQGLPKESMFSIRLEIGKGVTGWVAREKKTLALRDAFHDPRFVYFPEIEEERFKSMLSVPMLFKEQCIGVINVHNFEQRDYTPAEVLIMETIANQVSGCIRNAMLYNASQMLLKEQTILYDISMAVQTSLKLEHGLWIILSGITMGEAGGFNRAMLFTVSENAGSLDGIMGIGPDSPEDASRIWREWGNTEKDMLQWVITEANKEEYKNSAFNQSVRSLSYPIEPGTHVLAETVLEKKIFNITDAHNHPLVAKEFIETIGVNAFATVPLITHKEVLGVILVDNKYNNQPITEGQLRLLTRFTTHASWAMENSRLFTKLLETNRELLSTKEQLVQSEKLAALGEVSAEVAHEIKNPLVSIGGFARRLQNTVKKFSSGTDNTEKKIKDLNTYSTIITEEVSRLEKLLKNILFYSKAAVLEREEVQLKRHPRRSDLPFPFRLLRKKHRGESGKSGRSASPAPGPAENQAGAHQPVLQRHGIDAGGRRAGGRNLSGRIHPGPESRDHPHGGHRRRHSPGNLRQHIQSVFFPPNLPAPDWASQFPAKSLNIMGERSGLKTTSATASRSTSIYHCKTKPIVIKISFLDPSASKTAPAVAK